MADVVLCLFFNNTPLCYDQKRNAETNGWPTLDSTQNVYVLNSNSELKVGESIKISFTWTLNSTDEMDNSIMKG